MNLPRGNEMEYLEEEESVIDNGGGKTLDGIELKKVLECIPAGHKESHQNSEDDYLIRDGNEYE